VQAAKGSAGTSQTVLGLIGGNTGTGLPNLSLFDNLTASGDVVDERRSPREALNP